MTQEEIRETWQAAATRFYCPSPEELEDIYRRNKETALDKLAMKYKRFSCMSLVMTMVSCCYMMPNSLFDGDLRICVSLAFILYFGTCSAMDYWLYKGVSSIDCLTMTVKEVAEKAMYYKRRHLIFMAVLFPCALSVVGLMLYSAGFEKYLTMGVLAGAIVGGVIGYRHYLDFMDEYRKLSE